MPQSLRRRYCKSLNKQCEHLRSIHPNTPTLGALQFIGPCRSNTAEEGSDLSCEWGHIESDRLVSSGDSGTEIRTTSGVQLPNQCRWMRCEQRRDSWEPASAHLLMRSVHLRRLGSDSERIEPARGGDGLLVRTRILRVGDAQGVGLRARGLRARRLRA